MSGFERSMIRLTRAGVIIAIVTGFIFAGQLYEMISGGTQTAKLIKYASTQAKATSDIAQASDDFTDSAYWLEEHMQDAANAMQDSVDTADRNTKTTIHNAQTAFRDEQRAWVGIGQYTIDHFDNKDAFRLRIPWVNSGKTPAVDTETGVAYTFQPSPMTGPTPGHKYVFEKASALAPQGIYVTNITNLAVPGRFDAITNGTLWMYFFGQFRYRDVHSRKIHTTTFCLLYDRINKQMVFCESGNDMD